MSPFRKVAGSKSQIGQDSFVLQVLNYKRQGMYLEIGAGHPEVISNTYLLENSFGWRGISIELDQELSKTFNRIRNQICINTDATKMNYQQICQQHHLPNHFDYLSVDIDPPKNSFVALVRIMQSGLTFNVITFEHDLYLSWKNLTYKYLAKFLLMIYGYRCVVENVCNVQYKPQEDWYVHRNIRLMEKFPKNATFNEFIQDS